MVRRTAKVIAGMVSFLAGAFLCLASCTSTTYRITPRKLSEDLDAYLAAQEAKIAGLIPANARTILWAGATGQSTPFSIVFLHGYQGSPHDYGKYNNLSFDATRYPGGDPALYARYYPSRYRSESTIKLLWVMNLIKTLRLESIATPSVWLYSERDEAVDIPTLKGCYERAGSDP